MVNKYAYATEEKPYRYIYEFPNGLRQEPRQVAIQDARLYRGHLTYIGKHSNWQLLMDSRGLPVLLFESKNNIWDTKISKESRRVDTSKAVGMGQLYEIIMTAFIERVNPQHNYLRVVDSKSGRAFVYNYKIDAIEDILRSVVVQIFRERIDFVRFHTTPQGFAIVTGGDRQVIFSTLKKVVPATTMGYFITKLR